jgi:hypothetical protein
MELLLTTTKKLLSKSTGDWSSNEPTKELFGFARDEQKIIRVLQVFLWIVQISN